MKELYDLKEMLCDELKEYGKKGDLSAGSLEIVDKLAHALKNVEKVIECDEQYSGDYMYDNGNMNGNRGSYRRGRSYDNRSYARRRRDSMGRYASDGYSRHDDMIGELKYLMQNAEDDHTRMEFQKFIDKMEQM